MCEIKLDVLKNLAIASLIIAPFFSKAQQIYRSSGDSSRLGYFYGDQVLDATTSPDYKNAGKFTLNYYGSGDADANDTLDLRDYNAIVSGTKNDRTDVNGDGKTDNSDLNLLNDLLTKKIKYLPAHWNLLQTKTERENWLKKMLAIDKTDEKTYIAGKFDCDGFSEETDINFAGIEKIWNSGVVFTYVDTTNNMRFNIPMYRVTTTTTTGVGHRINAVLIGNDITDFNDWYFIEPQTDAKVVPGDISMNKNKPVKIDRLVYYYDDIFKKNFTYAYYQNIYFNLSNGVPSVSSIVPKAVQTRTIIPVYFNNVILPKDTTLEFGNSIDTSKIGIPENIFKNAFIEVIDSSNQTNTGNSSDVNYLINRYFRIQNYPSKEFAPLIDTLIGPQKIFIQDKTKPYFDFFPSDTTIINLGQKINLEELAQPRAKDNSNLPVKIEFVSNSTQNLDSTKCEYYNYEINLIYTAKDVSGNTESKTRKVLVKKQSLEWETFPSDTLTYDTSAISTGIPTLKNYPAWSSNLSYSDENLGNGIYNRTWTATENICNEKISRIQKIIDRNIGFEEISLENLKIYPNPIKDKITLEGVVPSYQKINWQLFDVSGKLIDFGSDEWYNGKNTEEISTSNLSKGIYLLEVRIFGDKINLMIIK